MEVVVVVLCVMEVVAITAGEVMLFRMPRMLVNNSNLVLAPEPYIRGGDWGNGDEGPHSRYMESSYERPRPMKNMYADDGSGHRIHMRGLPFRASEDDIAEVNVLVASANSAPLTKT